MRGLRGLLAGALAATLLVLAHPSAATADATVTLSGHITDVHGDPVDGGRLRVRAPGGQTVLYSTTSGADGAYSVDVAPGTYDLTYLGAPSSGLLARAPGRSIPVTSTFDAQVIAQSVHVQGEVISPVIPTYSDVRIVDSNEQPVYHKELNGPPAPIDALLLPGAYTVVVTVADGPANSRHHYVTYKDALLIEEDLAYRADLDVVVHAVSLEVVDSNGAPRPSSVEERCEDFTVGTVEHVRVVSIVDTDASGKVTALAPNATDPTLTCSLMVDPDTGPIQNLRESATTTSRTVTIPRGLLLSGSIVDVDGAPFSGDVFVSAAVDDGGAGLYPGRSFDATVASDGSFSGAIMPGRHELTATALHSSFFHGNDVTMRLTRDFNADTQLALKPVTRTITIHPVTPAGDPVDANAALQCGGKPSGQDLIHIQQTRDSASGTAITLRGSAMDSLYACQLRVSPVAGSQVTKFLDLNTAPADLDVTVSPGVTVSGTVTVPGLPDFGDDLEVAVESGQQVTLRQANADGTFTVAGVTPGDLSVRASYFQQFGRWYQFFVRKQLGSVSGDVQGVDLRPHARPLDVYLLGTDGQPAAASLKIVCAGTTTSSAPGESEMVEYHDSGTGLVRVYGLSMAPPSDPCVLTTTWTVSGLVMSKQVTIAAGGSTITQIETGSVTLAGDPTASNDLDDVPDSVEAYARHVGDGDDDGIPDYEQADVASLPENGGGLGSAEDYLTVAGPDGSTLDDVVTDDVVAGRPSAVAGPPDGSDLPLGFVDFTVAGVPAGSTQTVTIHVPSTAGMNGYAVYDPDTDTWTDMPDADVSFTPTTIVLTVTDGGPLDQDPVAGRIRHPGGGTRVDVGLPVVTGEATTEPNDKGWYDADVTVEWTVTDDQDTIDPPADTVVTTEGDDVTALAGEVCDRRGNCAVGKVEHLKIDKTKPVVNLSGPANGATYVIGAVPARACSATDPGGSGVPNGGACEVTVTGATVGPGVVKVVAKATDRAGNTATRTVTYTQTYVASLVAPKGGKKPKVFEQGSTVVVRVTLVDAHGNPVTPAASPVWVKPTVNGKTTKAPNQHAGNLKPDKGSVLIKRGDFWEFRWGTAKAKAGKTYLITVKLDDGSTRTVTIGLN